MRQCEVKVVATLSTNSQPLRFLLIFSTFYSRIHRLPFLHYNNKLQVSPKMPNFKKGYCNHALLETTWYKFRIQANNKLIIILYKYISSRILPTTDAAVPLETPDCKLFTCWEVQQAWWNRSSPSSTSSQAQCTTQWWTWKCRRIHQPATENQNSSISKISNSSIPPKVA